MEDTKKVALLPVKSRPISIESDYRSSKLLPSPYLVKKG